MTEWKKVRLGQIVKTNADSYSSKDNWNFVNYLDTGNITMNKIDAIQYIDLKSEKLPSRARRKVKLNSILYSTVRPNQLHYGIVKEKPTNFLVSTGFTVIDVIENVALPDFIYYILTQDEVTKQLQAIGEQSVSAYPSIKPTDIENLEIVIPNLEVQRRIVSILTAIDGKIKINERINKNIEQQAQALYEKMFGKSDLAKKRGVLAEICSYSKNKIAVSELNTNNYFSTENLLQGKNGAVETTSLPTSILTTACHKGDTLISNIRPYFKKILYCEENCGCSPDVLCFVPTQPRYSAFLFNTLYDDNFFDFMVSGSKGTKMPRGDKQHIMTYPVAIPSDEELEEYNSISFPILSHIHHNRKENKKLVHLRDTLLPRLMSGELDVSEVEI